MNRQSRSSFCLGSIVATKGALAACQNYSVSPWIYFGVMLRKIGATSASKTCRRIAKQSEVGSAYCLHIDFRHRSGFGSSPRLIEARQRFSCLRSTEQMPKTSAKRSRATAARDRTDERLQKTLSFCALSSDSSWWFDEERFGQAHFPKASMQDLAGSAALALCSHCMALCRRTRYVTWPIEPVDCPREYGGRWEAHSLQGLERKS